MPEERERLYVLERLVLGYTPKFQEILQAGRKQLEEAEGLHHDEFWQGVEAGDS